MNLNKFFNELKRRDVFRKTTAYAVTSWLILQVVVTTFPYIGIPDFWITVVIVLLVIGFPISIIISWVFELTPEGLKKTDEIDVSEEFEENNERKLNRVIIGILSTVIIFMIVERVFFAQGSIIERDTLSVQTASIAVLPFVDMSQNKDQEYFTDGLTEELLNVLAKVEGLQVAGRTSSFQYKGQNLDLRLIAEELGVDHVLEGSIRKAGNHVRITAQLIKADDGFHLWSENYDVEFSASNLFDIQDEISSKVLQELQVRLLPEKEEQISKNLTDNTVAYDNYLRANQLVINRNADDIEEAIRLYTLAIEEDPQFAAAYAKLAIAYDFLHSYGNYDRQLMIENMRINIDRALLIDPELGWAYAALGIYHRYLDNFDESHIALKKAFELIPGDPEIMIWYSQTVDSYQLSDELVFRAYETDPFSPLAIYSKARIKYDVDEFEEAIELMEKNLEVNPENSLSLSLKAEFYRDQPFGHLDSSFIYAYQAYLNEPGNLTYKFNLAEMSSDLGFTFIVEKMKSEINEIYPDNFSLLELRYDHFLYTGQHDSMLATLKQIEVFLETDQSNYYLFEPYMFMYFNAGWYEEARNYIETYFPGIPALDFSAEDYYVEDIALTAHLYDKLEEDEIAQALIDEVCDVVIGDLDFEGDLSQEIAQDLMDYLDCALLRKNKDLTIKIIDELHFSRKSKANLYTFIDGNRLFDFIRQDPDYRELRERMQDDVRGMTSNAEKWLRQNNYWQEDWVITETSY